MSARPTRRSRFVSADAEACHIGGLGKLGHLLTIGRVPSAHLLAGGGGKKLAVAAQGQRCRRCGQWTNFLDGLTRTGRIPDANELVRAGGDDLAGTGMNLEGRHRAGMGLEGLTGGLVSRGGSD